jgi:hypothetical protein
VADQVAAATFVSSNGTTFDITSLSLTDTVMAAALLYSAETTDDANQAEAITGVSFVADDGVSAGETTCGMATRSDDGNTATQRANVFKFTGPGTKVAILAPSDGTGNTYQIRSDYNAFITNGLRLTNVTTTSSTKGVALMFAGVSRAYCGLVSGTTSPGTAEDVGGAGNTFEPDLVIFTGSDGNFTGLPSLLNWGIQSLSFAVNDGTNKHRGSLLGWNDGSDPSDADGIVSTTSIPSMNTVGAFQTVTIAFTSTGFTATSPAGSPDMAYLAIKFADPDTRFDCFNFSIAASTGDQSFSCGFLPRAVIGMSQLITSEDTQTDGLGGFGRCIFTESVSRAIAASSQDGIANVSAGTPANAKTYQSDSALVTLANNNTLAHKATLSSFSGSGFTLNFTTAASAGLFTCLVIGIDLPAVVANDTVGIADPTIAFLNNFLTVSDTIDLSEICRVFTTDVSQADGPAGTVFTPGARRGTFLSGGAEAGTVYT